MINIGQNLTFENKPVGSGWPQPFLMSGAENIPAIKCALAQIRDQAIVPWRLGKETILILIWITQ